MAVAAGGYISVPSKDDEDLEEGLKKLNPAGSSARSRGLGSSLTDAARRFAQDATSSAHRSAGKIRFALRWLFLPDPLGCLKDVTHGYCDPSDSYATLGPFFMKVAGVILVLWMVVKIVTWPLSGTGNRSMVMGDPSIHLLPYVAGSIFLLGAYMWLIVKGMGKGISIIVHELRSDNNQPGDIAEEYGGRRQFLKDTSKVLDSDCQAQWRCE